MLLSQLFVSVTLLTAKGLSPLLADALQPDDPVRLAGADALRSFEASLVDGGEDLQGGCDSESVLVPDHPCVARTMTCHTVICTRITLYASNCIGGTALQLSIELQQTQWQHL